MIRLPFVHQRLCRRRWLRLPRCVAGRCSLRLVLAPTVAVQLAATLAVIVPLVLVMLVTLRPVGTVVAVTVKLPAAVSTSLTVAMVETVPALPCCRDSAVPAVIVGGLLLTVRV